MFMPYVYRVTNTRTGDFYFGSRTSKVMNNRNPESDLWAKYFTSSKAVKQQIEQYGKGVFRAEVIQICDTADNAFWVEQQYIKQSIASDFSLNQTYKDPLTSKRSWTRGGKHQTEEFKRRVSAKLTGRIKSEETIRKLSEAHKGKTKSAEHLVNLAKAVKGRKMPPCSEETKMKLSIANKGQIQKPVTEETKAKISAANTGRPCSEETKAKISAANKGRKMTSTVWNKGKSMSEETKEKMRITKRNNRKST